MARLFAKLLSGSFLLCLSVGTAHAQDPIAAALEDCATEIEGYCASVTPGEGRLLFCARAHQDKLSGICTQAINRATYWTDSLTMTMAYVASQCELDAATFCPNVELGEFRVLLCLEEKKESLSKYCALAVKDASR